MEAGAHLAPVSPDLRDGPPDVSHRRLRGALGEFLRGDKRGDGRAMRLVGGSCWWWRRCCAVAAAQRSRRCHSCAAWGADRPEPRAGRRSRRPHAADKHASAGRAAHLYVAQEQPHDLLVLCAQRVRRARQEHLCREGARGCGARARRASARAGGVAPRPVRGSAPRKRASCAPGVMTTFESDIWLARSYSCKLSIWNASAARSGAIFVASTMM